MNKALVKAWVANVLGMVKIRKNVWVLWVWVLVLSVLGLYSTKIFVHMNLLVFFFPGPKKKI